MSSRAKQSREVRAIPKRSLAQLMNEIFKALAVALASAADWPLLMQAAANLRAIGYPIRTYMYKEAHVKDG